MTGGFVYVLSNCAMPGLVKVGRTERMPTQRATELQTSGVPLPFDIEFAMWFQDSVEAEREIHEELHPYRLSGNREFFRVCAAEVAKRLTSICLYQMTEESYEVVDANLMIDDGDMNLYSQVCGVNPVEISLVIAHMTPVEWQVLTARYSSRMKQRKIDSEKIAEETA